MRVDTDAYIGLKATFEESADTGATPAMAAYMRNKFAFYGIPTPRRKAIYYVSRLIVKREYRRRGIGRELLTFAAEAAKGMGHSH